MNTKKIQIVKAANLVLVWAMLLCIPIVRSQENALTQADIIRFEKQFQQCMEDGVSLSACSKNYYAEMESCVSKAYQQKFQRQDKRKQTELRQEQGRWLKLRDEKFKEIDAENKLVGEEGEITRRNSKANFLREKAWLLLEPQNPFQIEACE